MSRAWVRIVAQCARAYVVLCALSFILWELWFLFIVPFVKESHVVMMSIPAWASVVLFPTFLAIALTMPINGEFLQPDPKWTAMDLSAMLVVNVLLLAVASFTVFSLMRDPQPVFSRIQRLIQRLSKKNLKYQVSVEGFAQMAPARITVIEWKRLAEIQVVFDLEGERAETHYLFTDTAGASVVVHGSDYLEQGLQEELMKHLPRFNPDGVLNAQGGKVLWSRKW